MSLPAEPTPLATSRTATPDVRPSDRASRPRADRTHSSVLSDVDDRIRELEADLQSLSHSIRSPLVALKGFANLLEDEASDQLGENGRHFLGRISEAGRRIEWRLNDLGQLLAVCASRIAPAWIDPLPVLDGLCAELKPTIEARRARIARPRESAMIWCDRTLLRTALLHLIGNALQHAAADRDPEILVDIRSGDAFAEISVADQGPGMGAELQARAFELFTCWGERRRVFEQGRESTGLGLALVRRIAQVHGGSVHIESEPGAGVRAVLRLPLEV